MAQTRTPDEQDEARPNNNPLDFGLVQGSSLGSGLEQPKTGAFGATKNAGFTSPGI